MLTLKKEKESHFAIKFSKLGENHLPECISSHLAHF